MLLLAASIGGAMAGALYLGVHAERARAAREVPGTETLTSMSSSSLPQTELPQTPPAEERILEGAAMPDLAELERLDERDRLAAIAESNTEDIVLESGVRIGPLTVLHPDSSEGALATAEPPAERPAPRRRARRAPRPPGPRLHPNPGQHSVLVARQMIGSGELIQGSCYAYLSAVYERAGHRGWRKRTIVYRAEREGPYADLDLIRPGDWLYIVTDPDRTPVGTHSVMSSAGWTEPPATRRPSPTRAGAHRATGARAATTSRAPTASSDPRCSLPANSTLLDRDGGAFHDAEDANTVHSLRDSALRGRLVQLHVARSRGDRRGGGGSPRRVRARGIFSRGPAPWRRRDVRVGPSESGQWARGWRLRHPRLLSTPHLGRAGETRHAYLQLARGRVSDRRTAERRANHLLRDRIRGPLLGRATRAHSCLGERRVRAHARPCGRPDRRLPPMPALRRGMHRSQLGSRQLRSLREDRSISHMHERRGRVHRRPDRMRWLVCEPELQHSPLRRLWAGVRQRFLSRWRSLLRTGTSGVRREVRECDVGPQQLRRMRSASRGRRRVLPGRRGQVLLPARVLRRGVRAFAVRPRSLRRVWIAVPRGIHVPPRGGAHLPRLYAAHHRRLVRRHLRRAGREV